MAEDRLWYLICYDIRDPKRWRSCYRLLKGYGERLQYSVFRCRLTKRQFERMRWELEQVLSPEDSLMMASLCSLCTAKLVARNTNVPWIEEEPRFRVI